MHVLKPYLCRLVFSSQNGSAHFVLLLKDEMSLHIDIVVFNYYSQTSMDFIRHIRTSLNEDRTFLLRFFFAFVESIFAFHWLCVPFLSIASSGSSAVCCAMDARHASSSIPSDYASRSIVNMFALNAYNSEFRCFPSVSVIALL